ncbi:helix-turn-helix domain-containing protein [Anaerotruncus rubiinfantis]|uniref:helix-turn-helix domain-containing protein n=1 Tax=Anaerotruncus rubiinfantis TaxID=1720200 RepID=UPI001899AC18
MTTGQLIKAARRNAGLTQKELGEKLDVTYQTLAQWENDLRNPKYETLQRIADALDVTVEYLRGLTNDPQAIPFSMNLQESGKGHSSVRKFSFSDSGTAPRTPEEAACRLQAIGEKAIEIADNLEKLNAEGQQKAADYVADLTKVPDYQKK